MKYLLMIFDRQDLYDNATPEQYAEVMQGHRAFAEYMAGRGLEFSGQALQQPNTATALQKGADGEWIVTDGPFPDTKEVIGGYYLFDAADLDDALEIAKHCPAWVGLEIRPIWDTSRPPA